VILTAEPSTEIYSFIYKNYKLSISKMGNQGSLAYMLDKTIGKSLRRHNEVESPLALVAERSVYKTV
jgi:hypothetical protein